MKSAKFFEEVDPVTVPHARFLFLALIAALAFTGCKEESEEVIYDGPPATVMDEGEVRYFEFPPDGKWHRSDILVQNQDLLGFDPQGLSAGLAYGAISFRSGLGSLENLLDPNQTIVFQTLAPLEFRASSIMTKSLPGLIEIKITKRE